MSRFLTILPLFFLSYFSTHAADYYWIGGSGNWSDISHWATSSGGVITHSVVPSADDDVYFDANSFTGTNQVVTINTDIIFCRKMDWTGAGNQPVFQSDDQRTLNIFGDLLLIPNMTFDFQGDINFRTAVPNTRVVTQNFPMGKSTVFEGNGGWILEGAIQVDSLFMFRDGDLNTNSQNIDCKYFRIDIQNRASLSLGASRITVTGNNIYGTLNGEFFAYDAVKIHDNWTGMAIDPGTSVMEVTGSDVGYNISGSAGQTWGDLIFSNPDGDVVMVPSGTDNTSFNELRFAGNATFHWHVHAANLVLAPGKLYDFIGNTTYRFDNITATGNCIEQITLIGRLNPGPVVFFSDSPGITVEYASMQNIHAQGSATFTANNSADLGNNDAWSFPPRANPNLYWVGGSGNWNDPAHWSFTSGGPGGACIPSGADNVFFDENSFSAPGQTVIINVENAYCRDMTWTGAQFMPEFMSDDTRAIHLFGSLTFIPEMVFSYLGQFAFEASTSGHTITSGNHEFAGSIKFNGLGGEWTFQDSIRTRTFVSLDYGSLITNNQFFSFNLFESNGAHPGRSLSLGNSHVYVRYFSPANLPRWHINSENLIFDAGNSFIEFGDHGGDLLNQGTAPLAYHKIGNSGQELTIRNQDGRQMVTIDSIVFRHGGYLQSAYQIGTLIMEPGFSYTLGSNRTQQIDQLQATGDCNGNIAINSDIPGQLASINSPNNQTTSFLILRDIEAGGGGQFMADQSVDLGNTPGWTFTEGSGRTLFWVGGQGNWSDPAHWSLSSGGSGGECIPGPLDDVIFDANSFDGIEQMVEGEDRNGYFCRNMSWQNVTGTPVFLLYRLYAHGSISMSPDMINYLGGLHMRGEGTQTITTNGIFFNSISSEGAGNYTLTDALQVNQLLVNAGTFSTNDQNVSAGRISFENPIITAVLSLGNSYVEITNGFDGNTYPLKVANGSNSTVTFNEATINFTDPMGAILGSGGVNLPKVIFSSQLGLSQIVHEQDLFPSTLANPMNFSYLEFANNAHMNGFNFMDSLLFAPGKSYQLEQGITQAIGQYFQILGNNCVPIELSSSFPGQKATIRMESGEVRGDYIQMQDQIAAGGATFFAGSHSTNIDNSNTGWTFEDRPDFVDVGFLGQDQPLCVGENISLSAYNYSPGETYEWSTGSDQQEIPITTEGTYWARVTFADMCEVIDTVHVFSVQPAEVELGPDTSFCEGESITLDATSNLSEVIYTWQDGSDAPMLNVQQPGTYSVELNRLGCIREDSIRINRIALPSVDLGQDEVLCEGEIQELNAGAGPTATYLWQDGSTDAIFLATQTGQYSVVVTENGCTAQDVVLISFNPLPSFDLGADTSLCTGEILSFDFTGLGDNYLWQDNSTASSLLVDQGGEYWLRVTQNNCSFSDTLQVAFFQTPEIELGDDQNLCEGESIQLDAFSTPTATYEWQDGSSQALLMVSQSGSYSVQVTDNGCTAQDEVSITFNPLPEFSLGADTSLCSGQNFTLNLEGLGDTYLWQDNSTASSLLVDQGGEYWLRVTQNNCSFSDTLQVAFFQTPEVELGDDQNLCEGESIQLDAFSTPTASYEWQDGSSQAVLMVSQSGSYSVQVTDNGCTAQDEVSITFNPLPEFSLGADTSLCSGQDFTLNLEGLGDTYLWQDNSTASSLLIDQGGEYWLRVTQNNCSFSDTLQVTFFQTPEVELGDDQNLCEGESIQLDAFSTPTATYEWQDGSSQAVLMVSQSGSYSVQVTENGCTAQDEVSITFNPLPVFSLGADTSLCSGQSFTLDYQGLGDSYLWNNGSSIASQNIDRGGEFWLEISRNDCSFRDSIQVALRLSPEVELGSDIMLCEGESTELVVALGDHDTFSWQDGTQEASLTVSQTGIYWIEASLASCTARDSILVQYSAPPDLGLPDSLILCRGERQILRPNVSGGLITWQDNTNSPEYTVVEEGLYSLSYDDGICVSMDSVMVIASSCGEINVYIPNVFSPNGDGINDYFLPNIDPNYQILEYDLKIFNRWGGLIFTSLNPDDGWHGRYMDEPAERGVYVYVIQITYEDQGEVYEEVLGGDVMLLK